VSVAASAASADDFAIRAEKLTKIYRLYGRPSDRVLEFLSGGRRKRHREVRGLQDATFTVPRGMTLGIVGSNGAGKSTLLKLLSGTTASTSGTFELRGRVASLLELGTGFYPGFSGRQNIVLNGIMNGYSRREIAARAPGIIEFSELGDFIDQPIRTYSSGMVMRLGFSVATAVDPDVLIIDEILAVGDLHFQKRCIDRIVEFKRSGKTILFCSHSMYHVEELCDRSLWIRDGRVEMDAPSREVTLAYSNYERGRLASHGTPGVDDGFEHLRDTTPRPAAAIAGADASLPDEGALPIVLATRLRDPHTGEALQRARLLKDVIVEIDYELPRDLPGVVVALGVHRVDQILIAVVASHLSGFPAPSSRGRWRVQVLLNRLQLLPAEYSLVGYLADESGMHIYHSQSLGTRFEVESSERSLGIIHLDHAFSAQSLPWPSAAERRAELAALNRAAAAGASSRPPPTLPAKT
jgi:ABC-type polysaccharide/polyol phosphate transport system ATPase subunit